MVYFQLENSLDSNLSVPVKRDAINGKSVRLNPCSWCTEVMGSEWSSCWADNAGVSTPLTTLLLVEGTGAGLPSETRVVRSWQRQGEFRWELDI